MIPVRPFMRLVMVDYGEKAKDVLMKTQEGITPTHAANRASHC